MSEQVPPDAYKKEFYYQLALQQQLQDINELTKKFPEEEINLRQTIQLITSSEPSRILDPEKLSRLREEQPETYVRIAPVYLDFLKEKAG